MIENISTEGHAIQFSLDEGDSPGLLAKIVCRNPAGSACKFDPSSNSKCMIVDAYDMVGLDIFRTREEVDLGEFTIKALEGDYEEFWIVVGDL